MSIKRTLKIVGLLTSGYIVGKIHGCIITYRTMIDTTEEAFPGYKRALANRYHELIRELIFKGDLSTKHEDEES